MTNKKVCDNLIKNKKTVLHYYTLLHSTVLAYHTPKPIDLSIILHRCLNPEIRINFCKRTDLECVAPPLFFIFHCTGYVSGIFKRVTYIEGGYENALVRERWSENTEPMPECEPGNYIMLK